MPDLVVVALRKSPCLIVKRKWVQIMPGTGLHFSFYFLNWVSADCRAHRSMSFFWRKKRDNLWIEVFRVWKAFFKGHRPRVSLLSNLTCSRKEAKLSSDVRRSRCDLKCWNIIPLCLVQWWTPGQDWKEWHLGRQLGHVSAMIDLEQFHSNLIVIIKLCIY